MYSASSAANRLLCAADTTVYKDFQDEFEKKIEVSALSLSLCISVPKHRADTYSTYRVHALPSEDTPDFSPMCAYPSGAVRAHGAVRQKVQSAIRLLLRM